MAAEPAAEHEPAAEKAKQFLQCGYRIDSSSPSLVAPTNNLFMLKEDVKPMELPKVSSNTEITDDSCERSKKVSTSFGIEGRYHAFSGAAEMSLEKYNASKTKTIRADHDLYAIKYVFQNNVLNYSDVLRDDVVQFCKNAKPAKIAKRLGHFYATEVTLGGTMSLTRIIAARSDDTASSLRASIEGSYGNVLVASVKAKASGGSKLESSLGSRSETCDMEITGGDVKHWLQFDGTDKSRATCHTAWAAGIEDHSLYPLKMRLAPIWEALEEHSELVGKAKELKTHLLSNWQSEYDRIKAMKKRGATKPSNVTLKSPETWILDGAAVDVNKLTRVHNERFADRTDLCKKVKFHMAKQEVELALVVWGSWREVHFFTNAPSSAHLAGVTMADHHHLFFKDHVLLDCKKMGAKIWKADAWLK